MGSRNGHIFSDCRDAGSRDRRRFRVGQRDWDYEGTLRLAGFKRCSSFNLASYGRVVVRLFVPASLYCIVHDLRSRYFGRRGNDEGVMMILSFHCRGVVYLQHLLT